MGLLDKLKKHSPPKQQPLVSISTTTINNPSTRDPRKTQSRPTAHNGGGGRNRSSPGREIGPGHLRDRQFSGTWPVEYGRMSRRDMFERSAADERFRRSRPGETGDGRNWSDSEESLPEELKKYLTMPLEEVGSTSASGESGGKSGRDEEGERGKARPSAGILRRLSSVIKLNRREPVVRRDCRGVVEGIHGEVMRTHR